VKNEKRKGRTRSKLSDTPCASFGVLRADREAPFGQVS
jgi:hypothetical protein